MIADGRTAVVDAFTRTAIPRLAGRPQIRVAVVGGSSDEPELRALREQAPAAKSDIAVELLGVEASERPLDLNSGPAPERRYDLVLCSQVLEHVWNHERAFDHLASLVAAGGLLWIGVPASNREHGSPEYFSAGFSPDYVRRNVERHGLVVIAAGQVGSPRLYVMTHALGQWPSTRELRRPLANHLTAGLDGDRSAIGVLRGFLLRVAALALPAATSEDRRWATETWVLAAPTA